MKKRILTGDRPTGRLHLGHWLGSLRNRVKLQDDYDCFLIIADLHTLTTRPEKSAELSDNVHQLVLDYLSVGINPEKATIFVQSQIAEICELAVIFSNLVTVPRLQRLPTIKDVMHDLKIEIPSFGLLGYPLLQSADILSMKGELVPVGRDQASHVEITREVAREFNKLYGETLPVPEALIPKDFGSLPGVDGKAKMSKSIGNVINLSDSKDVVSRQVMSMYTDPKRVHGDEPGQVEGNPVFIYLDAFSEGEDAVKVEEMKEKYRRGNIKDVEVKEFLLSVLYKFLGPIQNRRADFEKEPDFVQKILREGTERARDEAQKTLHDVKRAMKIDFFN